MWFVVTPAANHLKYIFIFINRPPEEAKKVFTSKLPNIDITKFIYVYADDLEYAWDEAIDLPGFLNPSMSLPDVIIRPDALVLNDDSVVSTVSAVGIMHCTSCNEQNQWAEPNQEDGVSYKCYKCRTGW